MHTHLQTYLSDHIALAVAGVELAKRCQASNKGSELGEFLANLIPRLEHEQHVLRDLLRSAEASESVLKNIAAWTAEKVGRFKPNDTILSYSPLSRVVELETLISGLHAQILMWRALEACSPDEPALTDIECAWFAKETQAHCDRLEELHQQAVRRAFQE